MSQRTCTREGCCRPIRARGLCKNHYEMWHRKLAVKPGITNSCAEILAAMPATNGEIAAKTGIKYETVRKAVAKMHKEGKVHIEDFRPPSAGTSGSRYAAIFTRGPGQDAKLSKKEVRENGLAVRRAWYAAKQSRPRRGDPLVTALFGQRAGA